MFGSGIETLADGDPVTFLVMVLPLDLGFRTKRQLVRCARCSAPTGPARSPGSGRAGSPAGSGEVQLGHEIRAALDGTA
jgi:hypothetical protein